MATNTIDTQGAEALSKLADIKQGTLVSFTVQKKGVTRGRGTAKKQYGDDLVQVALWVGFDYKFLCERSLQQLAHLEEEGKFVTTTIVELAGKGVDLSLEDACAAVQEVRDSLLKVVGGDKPSEKDEDSKAPAFEPLFVDGKRIPGCKVYIGDKQETGALYVEGVKLGEKVITPAANGRWKTASKPKTVAKKHVKDKLPASYYVSYKIGSAQDLLVGKDAAAAVKASGVSLDPERIRTLFKVAP